MVFFLPSQNNKMVENDNPEVSSKDPLSEEIKEAIIDYLKSDDSPKTAIDISNNVVKVLAQADVFIRYPELLDWNEKSGGVGVTPRVVELIIAMVDSEKLVRNNSGLLEINREFPEKTA
jgi:hypothetical protein